MIEPADIRRLTLAHYTAPQGTPLAGQIIVVCAYLIRSAAGLVLFDTGMAIGPPDVEARFGPTWRRPLQEALASAGLQVADVSMIANCHLHLDHCGNNPLFPRVPIFVQQQELDALPTLNYVMPELIDFDGARLEVHSGEADVAPGIKVIPTHGHTPGHQSLLVETSAGRVLLAGQAMDFASDYARAQFTLDTEGADTDQEPYTSRPWLHEVRRLDLRRVLFAHDLLAWDCASADSCQH
ncbi:MAG TPA: N-acyl homoserine lactonase family protein [Streptosporangiaceae bacterium]|nr:N-acyl homoserine lactonase family protein [Streptosporangiaceae bacterium]